MPQMGSSENGSAIKKLSKHNESIFKTKQTYGLDQFCRNLLFFRLFLLLNKRLTFKRDFCLQNLRPGLNLLDFYLKNGPKERKNIELLQNLGPNPKI